MLLTGKTVLVVEPEAFAAYALERRLRDLDASRVIVLRDAEEAALHAAGLTAADRLAPSDEPAVTDELAVTDEPAVADATAIGGDRADVNGRAGARTVGTAGRNQSDRKRSGRDRIQLSEASRAPSATCGRSKADDRSRVDDRSEIDDWSKVGVAVIDFDECERSAARLAEALRRLDVKVVRTGGAPSSGHACGQGGGKGSNKAGGHARAVALTDGMPSVAKPYHMVDIERAIGHHYGVLI